jgi:rubrerythrin
MIRLKTLLEREPLPTDVFTLLFSNLAISSAKLQRPNLMRLFKALAGSMEVQAKEQIREETSGTEIEQALGDLQSRISRDLQQHHPEALSRSESAKNRGALRALTWAKKVATIQGSLTKRVSANKDGFLKEGQKIFVCDACGFLFIGDSPPDVCPVCKAPASRFVSF